MFTLININFLEDSILIFFLKIYTSLVMIDECSIITEQGKAKMRRTMNVDTLKSYLSSTHSMIVMCRAHANVYELSAAQVDDIAYMITLSIVELEDLYDGLQASFNRPLKKSALDPVRGT